MEHAFFLACGLLLLGLILRARVRLLQVLYVPASVIGGILGLVLVQVLHRITDGSFAGEVVGVLKGWPGWLIAVVFAGLFLEREAQPFMEGLCRAAREGLVVWIIVVGQIVLGLTLSWLVLSRLFDVPVWFGQLIEVGFAGGHGTAAAMGEVYKKQAVNYPEGVDLAFFFATVGLVYSVVSGIFFVNLAVRRGWTRAGHVQIPKWTGLEARHHPEPIAFARVRAEVLDPQVFQALLLAAAFVFGMVMRAVLSRYVPWTENFPLFMYTLIGGLLVRDGMRLLGIGDLIDPQSIRRMTAAAMEFLIVAAITALNLQAVLAHGVPVAILLLVGFAWTAVCLLVIGRHLLPGGYWFELGIINYGMSTGTTAQGMMLLRIIDKDMESGAAEDFAFAAPLSAPFIGGGAITVALPLILQEFHTGVVIGSLALVTAICCALAWFLARPVGP